MTSPYIRTLPKNLTHSLKFPSLPGVDMRQTSNSIQSPGGTVNPAAARCRAELSPSPIIRYLKTFCTHQLPSHSTRELHSSPWHSITSSTSQAFRDIFPLRNSKNWSLHYSPWEDAWWIKPPESVRVLSSAVPPTLFPSPAITPHASPAFLEPSVPTSSTELTSSNGSIPWPLAWFAMVFLTSWELVPQRPQIHVPCGIHIVHNLMKHRSDLSSAN